MLPAVEQRCREIGRRRFARDAGINDGHLGRILSGAHRPSAATLAKLEQALRACPAPSGGADPPAADRSQRQPASPPTSLAG
ncbi:MAG: helix-turn-helix domain-containing protein [Acetobacteraceae bacterium]